MATQEVLNLLMETLLLLPASLIQLTVSYYYLPLNGKVFKEWPVDYVPRRIAHDHDSTSPSSYLYVLDTLYTSKSYLYEEAGTLLGEWGFVKQLRAGGLREWSPRAVAIWKGIMYLMHRQTLAVINMKEPTLINQWTLPDSKDARRMSESLVIDKQVKNRLYFTLREFPSEKITATDQIYVYSTKGQEIARYGTKKPGSQQGEFHVPCGLYVDISSLYICDYHNNRIQVLNKDNGMFVREWGPKGTLDRPTCITGDSQCVYVGDNLQIQMFTKQGKFLQIIGNGNGSMAALCLWKRKLYAADSHRILVFG